MIPKKITYGFSAELVRVEPATPAPSHPLRTGIAHRAKMGLVNSVSESSTPASLSPLISRTPSKNASESSFGEARFGAGSPGPSASLTSERPVLSRNRLTSLIGAAGSKMLSLVAPSANGGARIRPPAGCCR